MSRYTGSVPIVPVLSHEHVDGPPTSAAPQQGTIHPEWFRGAPDADDFGFRSAVGGDHDFFAGGGSIEQLGKSGLGDAHRGDHGSSV